MTEADWQQTFITIAGIATTLFPFLYVWLADWRNQVAVTLILSDVGMAALLDLSLFQIWWGWPIPPWVGTAVIAFIAATAVARDAMVPTMQIRGYLARRRARKT